MKNAPVVDRISGRLLGRVEQVLVQLPAHYVQGIAVCGEHGWHKTFFLARHDIWAFGAGCVVACGAALLPLRQACLAIDIPLYSHCGVLEGHICDVLIDTMGGIRGVQVSKSLVEDVKNGREILPLTGKLILGDGRAQRLRPSPE